ncbi:MAG: hypothetical protein ACQERN_12065 [Thermodesulfobacteriota bacterium]
MGNFKKLHIGTSGWNYKHWKGPFYPSDLSAKQWFSHYAEKFRTDENGYAALNALRLQEMVE